MAEHNGGALATLNKLYEVATSQFVPGQKTAAQLAQAYLSKHDTVDQAIDSLIAWQAGKTAVTGFALGLPGFAFLPATIPADLASLWYVQLLMVAAIAEMYGLDSRDDTVRTLAYASLLGSGVQGALSEVGAAIAVGSAAALIQRKVSGQALKQINKAIGFRLVTKAGKTGVVNLAKLAPIAGGLVGGAMNAVGTAAVGRAAKALLRPAPHGAQIEARPSLAE